MPNKTKEKKQEKVNIEHGSVGTDIFNGYIEVDYHSYWSTITNRTDTIKKMINSDSTISQILDAMKNPILSASKYLEYSGNEQIDEFARKQLFEKLDIEADLLNILTYIEQGFSLFEIVYEIDGPFVFWKKISPRIQSSIEKWTIDGEEWFDGHPAGVTQQVNNTDDIKNKKVTTVTIPWNKLMLFTRNKTGNNFEGESVLRSIYKHWKYKDVMYKVAGIYGERYGAGLPVIKFKKGTGKQTIAEFKELVKNIKSNKQAYAVIEDGNTLEIVVPKGGNIQQFLTEFIAHQDKKIYDRVNAGFLNLTTGDGGSNALSKDQSSFFLRTLQREVNYICSVINRHLRILIDLNFSNVEKYPEFCIDDVGQISMDELVNSLSTAKRDGLLTWRYEDEKNLREKLKIADISEDEFEISKQNNPNQNKEALKKKSIKTESTNQEDLKPSERERVFMRNIIDFENYLESEKKNFIDIVEDAEKKLIKGITVIYQSSETKTIDGKKVLVNSEKNKEMVEKAFDFIDRITKQLREKMIDSPIQKRIFNNAQKKAIDDIKQDRKNVEKILIDLSKFQSFVNGYISNVEGVLLNEPRKIKEKIQVNYGGQVSIDLAIEQAGKIQFNRNILTLSTITYPRALYNSAQYDANVADGFTHYKPMVAKQKMKFVNPSGMTSKFVYTVDTAASFNKKAFKMTDGKTTDIFNGLNLHHGAFLFFFAITAEKLEQEKKIAKKQREEFLREIEKDLQDEE